MSLHLEASRRVLLHIVGHLLDLLHRLRLQRRLTRLEEDVVGHELTRLGNGLLYGRHISNFLLIEFHSALGIAEVGHIVLVTMESAPICLMDFHANG